jgi:hypothetical protein
VHDLTSAWPSRGVAPLAEDVKRKARDDLDAADKLSRPQRLAESERAGTMSANGAQQATDLPSACAENRGPKKLRWMPPDKPRRPPDARVQEVRSVLAKTGM